MAHAVHPDGRGTGDESVDDDMVLAAMSVSSPLNAERHLSRIGSTIVGILPISINEKAGGSDVEYESLTSATAIATRLRLVSALCPRQHNRIGSGAWSASLCSR
jgi:hypothetical protein